MLWDRRGCGRSSDPGAPHTWQLWRDDLRGLLGHLGIDSAYLGGCSYGALLSLELALEWPRMVRALVLESGSPDGMRGVTMGLYRTFGDAGFVIGPVLLGSLADLTTFGWALTFDAVVLVGIALLFALFARETLRRPLVPQPQEAVDAAR